MSYLPSDKWATFDHSLISSFPWLLQTDPFNRSHLTPDMLIPDNELKAKIEEFVRTQAARKDGDHVAQHSSKGTIQAPTTDRALVD